MNDIKIDDRGTYCGDMSPAELTQFQQQALYLEFCKYEIHKTEKPVDHIELYNSDKLKQYPVSYNGIIRILCTLLNNK
jgi:hypothetical protein